MGLCVRLSILIDKTVIGQAPLHCFSKTQDCRVAMPENWVSKLNSCTELGLYVGSSHPKTMSEMTNPPPPLAKRYSSRYWKKVTLYWHCKMFKVCLAMKILRKSPASDEILKTLIFPGDSLKVAKLSKF